MALTDAERLQMTTLALMKYSVHFKAGTSGGGLLKLKLTGKAPFNPKKITPISLSLTRIV